MLSIFFKNFSPKFFFQNKFLYFLLKKGDNISFSPPLQKNFKI